MAAPTKMTKSVIATLKECFLADMTDIEACEIAGICDTTLDNYEKKHPEFLRLKRKIRKSTKLKARVIIANGIREGDKNDAKWYLERRDPEYKQKSEVKNTIDIDPATALINAIKDRKAKRGIKE